MIGFYNYTVYLTYASLFSAMIGVYSLAINDGKGVGIAIICMMISGFLDLFDGIVARTKKDRTSFERRNGIQIDSLVDLVAFGVLPALIGYKIGITFWWGIIITFSYVLASVIRLSYFNCLTEEPINPDFSGFVGVPVTSAALVFPIVYLMKKLFERDEFKYFYALIMLTLAMLFVSKVKIKKPGKKVVIAILLFGFLIALAIILRYFRFKGRI
ncbi:MAG: CDP-alcohol phosphatidyltransferase family protein [Acholeplasma sp.]|nr:CDP-alcohol phosphatidyltransferase family protein [Acholeplasma sp.]